MKSKIIKLSESDIAKLVVKIIQEGHSIEELLQVPDIEMGVQKGLKPGGADIDVEPKTPGVQIELTLAQNPDNNDVYILKNAFTDEPEILGVVRNAQF